MLRSISTYCSFSLCGIHTVVELEQADAGYEGLAITDLGLPLEKA